MFFNLFDSLEVFVQNLSTVGAFNLGMTDAQADLANALFIVFSNILHFFMTLGFLYLGYKMGKKRDQKSAEEYGTNHIT